MTDLKIQLYNLCAGYVQQRIDAAQEAIQLAQESAAEDTKSSAGDKYETGREMLQQETDRNMAQLTEAGKLMVALKAIQTNQANTDTVQQGSLVITDNGKFYISISAGALTLNGETYFAVSMASPIGVQLSGKKVGDGFSVNKKEYLIKEII